MAFSRDDHSLQTLTASLATPQSAAVIAGCDLHFDGGD